MTQVILEATNAGTLYSWLDDGDADYATAHDKTVGDADNSAQSFFIGQMYNVGGDNLFYVVRAGLEFDISAILAGATITAGTLSLAGAADFSVTNFDMTLVSGTDLANILVGADYGDLLNETTSYGALTTLGLLILDWNVITLNAAGIAAIQAALTSGVIRFGLRSSRDISNTTPKLNGGNANEYVEMVGFASYAGVYYKPKLTINYTMPSYSQAYIIG